MAIVIESPLDDMAACLTAESKSSGPKRRVDALMVLYSCRKYLSTRVAVIRRTWMKQSLPHGVELLIVVGDGPDRTGLAEEVIALACPDDYQSLSMKTLCLARHVQARYEFSTLIKIDDDCYIPDVRKLVEACKGWDYVGFQRIVNTSERLSASRLPSRFFLGGTYAISSRVVTHAAKHATFFAGQQWGSWEDVMLGRIVEDLSSNNQEAVKTLHDPRFGSFYKKSFLYACACLKFRVALMHIQPRRMLVLHWLNATCRRNLRPFAMASSVGLRFVSRFHRRARPSC